jgi:hypothetical protein
MVIGSTWAGGVAGLVLVVVMIAALAGLFRNRFPEGRLLLGILGMSFIYNLADDHGAVWLLALPPILVVLREPIARSIAPRAPDDTK